MVDQLDFYLEALLKRLSSNKSVCGTILVIHQNIETATDIATAVSEVIIHTEPLLAAALSTKVKVQSTVEVEVATAAVVVSLK